MGIVSRGGMALAFAVLFAAGSCLASDAPAAAPARLIAAQDPPKVVQQILDRATPDNTSITISLARQRASLLVDGEAAIDTPISSGKRRGLTPAGDYTIAEKRPEFRSGLHGDFVDREGRVVRAGVSSRIDAAPSGTVFRMVPVQFFMRLEPGNVSLHAGRLPGHPVTDGAVRLPRDIAPLIYERVKAGTPVTIVD